MCLNATGDGSWRVAGAVPNSSLSVPPLCVGSSLCDQLLMPSALCGTGAGLTEGSPGKARTERKRLKEREGGKERLFLWIKALATGPQG